MTERIPQSTSKLVMFKAYLDSDHVTEATGKTIAITISKNGGAFGNPSGGATNATEISSGWYKVTLSTTDTGTLGPLAVRGAQADIDDVGVLLEVAADAAAVWAVDLVGGGLGIAGDLLVATADFTNNTDANVVAIKVRTDRLPNINAGAAGGVFIAGTNAATTITTGLTTTFTGNLTGSVGSVTGAVGSVTGAVGSVTGLTASDVGAIKLKTDNLPSDPADQSFIIAATDALATLIDALPTNAELAAALASADDAVLAQVALVKAKTDLIPGTQDGLTFAQQMILMAAVLLGKASGLETTTAIYRAADDSKGRVTATVDADGNRARLA